MTPYLYRIEARHFVAGLEATDGWVVRAAPIVKYMVGWTVFKVRKYCEKKHWKIQKIEGDG